MTAAAAAAILAGYEGYRERFAAITRGAVAGFADRDWRGIREKTVRRLGIYREATAATLAGAAAALGDDARSRSAWAATKEAFAREILGRDDFELAQTFFNSLSRKAFDHVGVDPAIDFTPADFPLPYRGWELARARTYAVRTIDATLVGKVLVDAGFRVPFRDLAGDEDLEIASCTFLVEQNTFFLQSRL